MRQETGSRKQRGALRCASLYSRSFGLANRAAILRSRRFLLNPSAMSELGLGCVKTAPECFFRAFSLISEIGRSNKINISLVYGI
jgi:hypothetical protein